MDSSNSLIFLTYIIVITPYVDKYLLKYHNIEYLRLKYNYNTII